MAWYDRFIGTKQQSPEVVEGYQSFSTPFGRIGSGNLSLPYVNGRHQTSGWIPFGEQNLFPSVLNQLVYSSPLHGSIVDYKTNAVIGGGIELRATTSTPQELLDLYTFEKKSHLKKTVRITTEQLIVHNRVYFQLPNPLPHLNNVVMF